MSINFKNSYMPIFLGLLFLLILSMSFFWVYESKVFVSRASIPRDFSSANSYVFATPIAAAADGEESIRIYVFLLDERGIGVSGISMTASNKNGALIKPVQPITNEAGQALFDLSSTIRGSVTVTFEAKGSKLNKDITVSFR